MLCEIGKRSGGMLEPVVGHLNTSLLGLDDCVLHDGVADPCQAHSKGGPAPKSGTRMDLNVINLSTMEQASLLQPVMAGREVRREPGADGTGAG